MTHRPPISPRTDTLFPYTTFFRSVTQPNNDRLTDDPSLVVEYLTVKCPTADCLVNAVSDLSYSVELGKTLGIVGESGSGKSVSSMAILGLHDAKRSQITGSIRVGGKELLGLSEEKMRPIRGNQVAMIFQDALRSEEHTSELQSLMRTSYDL